MELNILHVKAENVRLFGETKPNSKLSAAIFPWNKPIGLLLSLRNFTMTLFLGDFFWDVFSLLRSQRSYWCHEQFLYLYFVFKHHPVLDHLQEREMKHHRPWSTSWNLQPPGANHKTYPNSPRGRCEDFMGLYGDSFENNPSIPRIPRHKSLSFGFGYLSWTNHSMTMCLLSAGWQVMLWGCKGISWACNELIQSDPTGSPLRSSLTGPPWCFVRWGNPWIGRLGLWGISPNPGRDGTRSGPKVNRGRHEAYGCWVGGNVGGSLQEQHASLGKRDQVRPKIWMLNWIVGSPVCLAERSKITFACRWNNDLLMRRLIKSWKRNLTHHPAQLYILLYILGCDKSSVLLLWTKPNIGFFPKRRQRFHAIAAICLRMRRMHFNFTNRNMISALPLANALRGLSFDTSTPRSFMYFWKSWDPKTFEPCLDCTAWLPLTNY